MEENTGHSAVLDTEAQIDFEDENFNNGFVEKSANQYGQQEADLYFDQKETSDLISIDNISTTESSPDLTKSEAVINKTEFNPSETIELNLTITNQGETISDENNNRYYYTITLSDVAVSPDLTNIYSPKKDSQGNVEPQELMTEYEVDGGFQDLSISIKTSLYKNSVSRIGSTDESKILIASISPVLNLALKNINPVNDEYCFSANSLWECIDQKVELEGTYVQAGTDNLFKGFIEVEFKDVTWGENYFESIYLGPFNIYDNFFPKPLFSEKTEKRIILEGIPRIGEKCCKDDSEHCTNQCMIVSGQNQESNRWPNYLEVIRVEEVEIQTTPQTYTQILTTNPQPALSPNYQFPTSYQYQNGCFGFAVKHITEHKYNEEIDLHEVEQTINKPRADLWTSEHINNFLRDYNLKLTSYNDAETFFNLLENGEPIIIQYKYPTTDGWVGHMVAAYSFDEAGVWISESISGQRKRIAYADIFAETGQSTQFSFSKIEKIIDSAPERELNNVQDIQSPAPIPDAASEAEKPWFQKFLDWLFSQENLSPAEKSEFLEFQKQQPSLLLASLATDDPALYANYQVAVG